MAASSLRLTSLVTGQRGMVDVSGEPKGKGIPGRRSSSQQRQDLAREGARAVPRGRGQRRKVLSQNLLRDREAIRCYIDAVGSPDVRGVELGAGDGTLTLELAGVVPHLTAVELDPVFARTLRQKTREVAHVEVLEQDLLAMPAPDSDFVLLGNIPFAITTRIMKWALDSPRLRSATLITQREYARKRTGDYGRWSLTTIRTWPWWDWRLGPRIHRESFRPRPSVDAAVLHLDRRRQPLLAARSRARWERAVATGFTGLGGSLHASLGTIYPRRHLVAAFDRAGVARDQVVGFIAPDDWLAVFSALEDQSG
jgi:23S rRNA (adenine-N6)-dimethyltransferase